MRAGSGGSTGRMTDERIARWRLRTQGLTEPRSSCGAQVVQSLLAVQAENPAQSAWAVATRTRDPDADDLAGLLDSGEVLRTHVLRSTWHYVGRADVGRVQLLTAPRLRPVVERGLTEAGFTGADVDRLAGGVLGVLGGSPDRVRPELAAALIEEHPDLAERLTGVAMLYLMAWCEFERLVISGRPRAGANRGAGGEHTYALWEERVGPRAAAAAFDREAALAEVSLRYVTGHGPVTAEDLVYWATLPIGQARRGLAAAAEQAGAGGGTGLGRFEHDGRTYWYAGEPPSETELDGVPHPRGHLLQLLDEMYRGYQDSRWVLDAAGVVPRGRETAIGIALVDGQLVARMKRSLTRTTARFQVTPYRSLTSAQCRALEDAATRYAAFLGLVPALQVMAC